MHDLLSRCREIFLAHLWSTSSSCCATKMLPSEVQSAPTVLLSCYKIHCFSSFPGVKTGLFRSTQCLLKPDPVGSHYEVITYFSGRRNMNKRFRLCVPGLKCPFFPFCPANNRKLYQGFCETAQKGHLEKSHPWRNLFFPLSLLIGRFLPMLLHTRYFLLWVVNPLELGISYWALCILKRETQDSGFRLAVCLNLV